MWYFPKYYVPRPVPANPYFGAAVTYAFGEGLKNPEVPPNSKLAGFLNHSNPGTLKYDDVMHPIPGGPMVPFQENHRYLMVLVGFFWRLFGVSWAALGPLVGIMAAVSALCVYGILRTRARPLIAACGAAALLASPTYLGLMHYIRDYAKTPVFFMAFYLMSILLTRTLSSSRLLLMGVAFGVVIGIGGGIRLDLEVIWVVVPFLYLFFLPTGVRRMSLARLGSLAVAVAVFIGMSAPAARNPHNLTSHLLIMGLLKYNQDSMGVGGAPYIWYNESLMTDSYVNQVIQDQNRRMAGKRIDVNYGSLDYDRAGKALVANIVRNFPADFVTRFLAASVTTIRDAPWLIVGALPTMYDISNTYIQRLQPSQRALRLFWNQYGPWLVFLALMVLSWHSLRLALATTGLLLFFTGYSALQFQPRHFWHLGLVFVCVVAFLAEETLRGVQIVFGGTATLRSALGQLLNAQRAKRAVCYVLTVVVGLVSTLGAARLYQSYNVKALYAKYRTASLMPIPITSIDEAVGGTRTIHATPAPIADDSDIGARYDFSYIAVQFEGSGPLPTSFNLLNNNFSPISVQGVAGGVTNGPATVYLPWFRGARNIDIEIRGGDPAGKVSIYSIVNRDEFPIPMLLVLPKDSTSLATHAAFTEPKRDGV